MEYQINSITSDSRNIDLSLKILRFCTLMILLIVFPFTAESNTKVVNEIKQVKYEIQGKVVDVNGEVVIGAIIIESGTTNGTITDMNGNFTLSVNPKSTIAISFIGFKTTEISIDGSQNFFNITLEYESEILG